MERWQGKVALVTGANSGCGAAIGQSLVKHGMKVIAVDIHDEQMKKNSTKGDGKGSMTIYKADLTKDDQVEELFAFIEKKFGFAHVVVNAAGIIDIKKILETGPADWRKITEINVIGTTHVIQKSIAAMRKANYDDGHIVTIGSIAALKVMPAFPFYSATKFAIRAVSEAIRLELRELNSNMRISVVHPGHIRTNLLRNGNASEDYVEESFRNNPYLEAENIASIVEYMLAAPQNVQVTEATVSATKEVYGPPK